MTIRLQSIFRESLEKKFKVLKSFLGVNFFVLLQMTYKTAFGWVCQPFKLPWNHRPRLNRNNDFCFGSIITF